MTKKELKNARKGFFVKNEEFQTLFIKSRYTVSDNQRLVNDTIVHIFNFIKGFEGKQSLNEMFKGYCKSLKGSFKASDVVSIHTWAQLQECTIKSCVKGHGLFIVRNGEKMFFSITRDKKTGELFGEWLKFSEIPSEVELISEEEVKARKILAEKKQLEKLLKKYGN